MTFLARLPIDEHPASLDNIHSRLSNKKEKDVYGIAIRSDGNRTEWCRFSKEIKSKKKRTLEEKENRVVLGCDPLDTIDRKVDATLLDIGDEEERYIPLFSVSPSHDVEAKRSSCSWTISCKRPLYFFIYLSIYLVLKRKGRDRCWWMLVGATGLGFPISKILKIFLATTTTTKTHLEFLFFFLLLQPSRNDGWEMKIRDFY